MALQLVCQFLDKYTGSPGGIGKSRVIDALNLRGCLYIIAIHVPIPAADRILSCGQGRESTIRSEDLHVPMNCRPGSPGFPGVELKSLAVNQATYSTVLYLLQKF